MGHTPGPWTACQDGKCKCKHVNSENHPIAHIICGEWGDEYPDIRLVERKDGIGKHAEAYIEKMVYGSVDPDFAEANARLIAAAPALLAACEEAQWYIQDLPTVPNADQAYDVIKLLCAAIAKAKGDK
jgi:hypothetical protein